MKKKQPKVTVMKDEIPQYYPDAWLKGKAAEVAAEAAKETPKSEISEGEEMTGVQMEDLLIQFYRSPTWRAYQKYNAYRLDMVDDMLRSIDPFKEPTLVTRNQGIREGILDLGKFIEAVIKSRNDKNAPTNVERVE